MQSLAFISFIILIIGLTFLVFKWPRGIHVTFSGHAAKNKFTIIYYNILLTIVMSFLVIFFATWFVPFFHLPLWFFLCIVISCIFQYAATIIPEVGGWKTTFHQAVTLISVIFLLPVMGFLVFADSISLIARGTAGICLLIMLGVLGITAVRRSKQRYLLLLQIIYYAAFYLAILIATYS